MGFRPSSDSCRSCYGWENSELKTVFNIQAYILHVSLCRARDSSSCLYFVLFHFCLPVFFFHCSDHGLNSQLLCYQIQSEIPMTVTRMDKQPRRVGTYKDRNIVTITAKIRPRLKECKLNCCRGGQRRKNNFFEKFTSIACGTSGFNARL